MNRIAKLAGLAGAGVTATALLAAPANAAPAHSTDGRPPVFVQTDDPAGNTVVAYDRTDTGSLVRAGSYATGGLGGVLGGSVVDHTASQGALAYDSESQLLFAVNAGSNTITTFAVHGDRLVRRQVLSSGGSFPVSIAANGDLVYVLNARDGGSIQGYLRVGGLLVRVPQWHRSLGLDPQQTPEFTSTPGQITFAPGGHRLLVTTKNGANSIDVFRVGLTGPSATPTVNSLPGDVPFSVSYDRAGHVDVAEAGPNAVATFTLNPDGTLAPLDSSGTGQAATCWIVSVDGHLYLSNAGSANVSRYAVADDGALTALGTTATDAGTIDAAASADGQFLYVQAGGQGEVDAYRIGGDGSLTPVGTVTVPNAVGGEGIVAL
ncbi:MAG TPA: beta-propeller fold lactonase family protein [Jatrophihabitans sp.]|nr:beta-propeller fold lactonase family protein [Jatrophihabitans sp.]